MKTRSCQLWMVICNDRGDAKRYHLVPLAVHELGQAVMGFRMVNRSEDPAPVYAVRVTAAGYASCTCPAWLWDRQKGESPNAPPDQPPPSCKHCEALRAAGLLPPALREQLQAQYEAAEAKRQLEATTSANENLRKEIARLNADLDRVEARKPRPRRSTKAKAA